MKKIIYINLDGFSYSYFEIAKQLGKTKIFDQFSKDGFIFHDLRSGIFSITNPMQAAILSGAYSNKTHNFYQHYDCNTKQIVKHLRTNDAENVAQAYLRNNLSTISIHQFMLENNPCQYDTKNQAYFKTETMPSNYWPRFEILKKIILKEPVKSKDRYFIYEDLPDFISLYVDDLDSLGHNNREYDGYPIRSTLEERHKDIIERMVLIQEKILEIVNICISTGIYDDLLFLITTDHGMTKFEGFSLINDLLEKINNLGIKASLPQDRLSDNELILLPYNISCSVYYDKELSMDKQIQLKNLFSSLDYVNLFTKKELLEKFSMDERGPEFLLTAKPYKHFYHRDYPYGTYGASHDSFDDTSQHIFGILFGAGVNKLHNYYNRVDSIDLIPTIVRKIHGVTLKDATGKINEDFFVNNNDLSCS